MRAERFRGSPRPICRCRIHVAESETTSRQIMRTRRSRSGLPENVCGRPVFWLVDGQPMCLSHAGQAALAALERLS